MTYERLQASETFNELGPVFGLMQNRDKMAKMQEQVVRDVVGGCTLHRPDLEGWFSQRCVTGADFRAIRLERLG
ncbi:hypothetical protein ACFSOZ_34035 [Mesorhizobium newzealandense]|uniref:Uncharacterized protein n=1 Tax=Mesorhizobium newzealandense TaxID=1300302 RepID=A0ABW4UK07_9HYPH